MTELENQLLEALKDATKRFRRCMIASGQTSEEYADIACEQFNAAISAAELHHKTQIVEP